MRKYITQIIAIAATLLMIIGVPIGLRAFYGHRLDNMKVDFVLPPPVGSIDKMIEKADAVIVGEPTGSIKRVKDGYLTIKHSEIKVLEVIDGEVADKYITLVQTEELFADPVLEDGTKYVMIIVAPMGDDMYRTLDAHRGVFPLNDKGEIMEYEFGKDANSLVISSSERAAEMMDTMFELSER